LGDESSLEWWHTLYDKWLSIIKEYIVLNSLKRINFDLPLHLTDCLTLTFSVTTDGVLPSGVSEKVKVRQYTMGVGKICITV